MPIKTITNTRSSHQRSRIAAFLTAVPLILLPGIASAWDCASKVKETTASACADGFAWDSAKGACVMTPVG